MVEEQEEKYELSDLMKSLMDTTKGLNPAFYEKYEKVGDKAIGTGLFSHVWKVKRKGDESGKIYAAKEFNDNFNTGYAPEVAPLRLLDHPNIVKLVEEFPNEETGGVFVLDLIEGRVLKDVMQEMKGELVPKKQLFTWFVQMAAAMTYCSEEIYVLHTDLHDENWKLRDDGQMMLLDFTTGRVLGKDGFMSSDIPFGLTGRIWNPIGHAPEQGESNTGGKGYGFPAEVWWLAAVFSCMANKEKNYCWEYADTKYADMRTQPMANAGLYAEIMAEKKAHIAPPAEYGEEFTALMAQMLQYEPELRPKMSDVLNALKEILATCE